jgi:DNA-binding NtrC family response regulator
LNVITVTLPDLRERASDIPLLVKFFMERFKGKSRVQSISPDAMERLMTYPWPGNVRELANAIEYAMVMAPGTQITETDLPEMISTRNGGSQSAGSGTRDDLSLNDQERELIIRTLKDCRGNKHLAAKKLKIPRSTLYSKLQKHGIDPDKIAVDTGRNG